MNNFRTNKISESCEVIAQTFRRAREARKLSLDETAKQTHIGLRYLEIIENGYFDKLPKGIYGKNFLKEYAEFLNLNAEDILKQVGREIIEKRPGKIENLFSERISGSFNFLCLPKLIKNTVVVMAVLVCIIYLASCFKGIISPPSLSVTSPSANLITDSVSVNIEGYSEPEAKVTINGLDVLLDANGHFFKKISLKNGLNTISITAQKKYSKKNNIIKKILVNTDS